MAERFLYRGTTRGWPGSPSARSLRLTPATTDPLVATLFAIECSRHGASGLHLAPVVPVARSAVHSNWFADLESEIVLNVSPLEFESVYSKHWVAVDEARSVLRAMGFQLPETICSHPRLGDALREASGLKETQIAEFNERVIR